jgi:hypothetical protein
MGPIGKGLLLQVERPGDGSAAWPVRPLTFVAIYSAVGLRDEARNHALGAALREHPFPAITSLRREAHESGPSCWLHADVACWTQALIQGAATA